MVQFCRYSAKQFPGIQSLDPKKSQLLFLGLRVNAGSLFLCFGMAELKKRLILAFKGVIPESVK